MRQPWTRGDHKVCNLTKLGAYTRHSHSINRMFADRPMHGPKTDDLESI